MYLRALVATDKKCFDSNKNFICSIPLSFKVIESNPESASIGILRYSYMYFCILGLYFKVKRNYKDFLHSVANSSAPLIYASSCVVWRYVAKIGTANSLHDKA